MAATAKYQTLKDQNPSIVWFWTRGSSSSGGLPRPRPAESFSWSGSSPGSPPPWGGPGPSSSDGWTSSTGSSSLQLSSLLTSVDRRSFLNTAAWSVCGSLTLSWFLDLDVWWAALSDLRCKTVGGRFGGRWASLKEDVRLRTSGASDAVVVSVLQELLVERRRDVGCRPDRRRVHEWVRNRRATAPLRYIIVFKGATFGSLTSLLFQFWPSPARWERGGEPRRRWVPTPTRSAVSAPQEN